MIERLRSGNWTQVDQQFFQHEMLEAKLMAMGLGARAAHLLTLKLQGLKYEPGVEAEIYHADVIKRFREYFNLESQRRADQE